MGTVAIRAEEVGAVSTAGNGFVIGLATGANGRLSRDGRHVHQVGQHVVGRKALDAASPQGGGELALEALDARPLSG